MPAPKKFQDPSKKAIPVSQLLTKPVLSPKAGGSRLLEQAEVPRIPELIETKSASGTPKVTRQSDLSRSQNVRDALKAGWTNISRRTLDFLQEGDRLETLLGETKLRDIGIFAGISTEKVLLMEGQPTQIIAQPQQAQLDKIGQALQVALQQRGLAKEVKLVERTATIKLDEK